MRTSHREIRKRILDEKSKISDEEFFSSKAYQAYLTDITEAATSRYRRPIKVRVVADHNDDTLAFTDFNGIFINACNEITWSMPTRRLRSLSIEGLNAHENGHNLFTDNRIWNAYLKKLADGKFFPSRPDNLSPTQSLYATQILDALQDDSDDVPQMVIRSTAKGLINILEDGYVDARYSFEYPGNPARGIALNNLRIAERAPDISTMINQKYYDHNIVLNLLVQYVNAGEINNLSGYSGELLDMVSDLIPIVDSCILDDDARVRCDVANRILIDLWPMMQRCFDALRDMKNQQNSASSGSGGASGTGGQGQPISSSDSSGTKAAEEALESQLPQAAPNFTVKTSAVPSNASFTPDKNQSHAVRAEISRVLAEETERIAAHVTSRVESGDGKGGVDFNYQYEGNGYAYAAEDMERVLESMAEARVQQAMEEELSAELQQEAERISFGNAHRNIRVTVNRMARVDPDLIEGYNRVSPQLLLLSKRLQRKVGEILRDKRQGGKQTGLLAGKRLNQHAFHRTDGRIFCNTRLPTEPINLAVGLLVDESGSMCGHDRITNARATAIVIQDFCEKLGIPLVVMGHTASSKHVEMFSYVDFDAADKNDRYRLMDMSARYCNRDGAALRYIAERLHHYPAEVKMLIIICDGQPNDDGYSGSAAEADLRGIKIEYTRKGVNIFAAAIGDDRDKIERIYGTGFLDITNLESLPILLTNLISRQLPV